MLVVRELLLVFDIIIIMFEETSDNTRYYQAHIETNLVNHEVVFGYFYERLWRCCWWVAGLY